MECPNHFQSSLSYYSLKSCGQTADGLSLSHFLECDLCAAAKYQLAVIKEKMYAVFF